MGRGERQPDLRDVFALRVAVAAHELRSYQVAGRGLEGEQSADCHDCHEEAGKNDGPARERDEAPQDESLSGEW
jgi:hypothetical protein